jgi:hypothetical protein
MTKSNITTTVRANGSDVSIIEIRGDVNGAAEEVLVNAFARATAPTARNRS